MRLVEPSWPDSESHFCSVREQLCSEFRDGRKRKREMLPLVREQDCGVKGLSAAAVVSVSVATSREIDTPSAGARELSAGGFPPNSPGQPELRPRAPPRLRAESFSVWT